MTFVGEQRFFLGDIPTHLLVAITDLVGTGGRITLPLKKSITESPSENKVWEGTTVLRLQRRIDSMVQWSSYILVAFLLVSRKKVKR